jgi:N4-gp56 family major capsid protein
MPQIPNSYAKQSTQQKIAYDRVLLSRLNPKLVFMQFGQTNKRSIPKKEGDTIEFRRFNKYPPATTPLVEGVTPNGRNMSVSKYRATVEQYGDFTITSDLISLMGIDPVVVELLEVHGEQAAETLDIVVRNVVCSGSNVLYLTPGAVARNQMVAGSNLDATAVRRVRQIMARNNVDPLSGGYVGIIHPDVVYDLTGSQGWVDVSHYGKPEQIFNGEVGKLWGIRFIETTMAPIWPGAGANGEDIYGTIIIGKDAYGVVDVAGSSKPETIVHPLGSAGTADPLNQRASVGWKALMTAVRLQELAILRVESTVSL